ncbi:TonB-dependent receptor [Altererythrobacter sp. CC-YST694]|uniref:TonB-dependent receptor n=1 Tax=Altererythrobacter sp. CC-YST694 TaxID=2755038 RepID=UPI001D033A63|nr:TonB-dependent receptor [Altererythrobacter sp. CC-YST694]MCB5426629.1 TonB-dependent receptor [Altererythrobacter sp. CC-YST694]
MKMRICLLAGGAVAALSTPAFAQDTAGQDEVYEGEEIVVTGHGLEATPSTIAYSTVVVDQEQLTSTASGRIEDALSNVAGFQQFRRSDSRSSNPTAQGVTLRALGGNASSRALVLLDGVPMIDPFFGHVPLSALSPNQLEMIRVTRGGGSGPFGAGALAGTVELESIDASDLGLVRAQAMVNDRGDTELEGSLAPQWGSGFAVVSGRWDRGDGFWTTPKDQRVAASVPAAYESWSANARVVQQLGADVSLQVRGLAFEDNRTLRFAGADNATKGQDISVRLVGRGDWQFDVLGYGQWRNFSNIVISSSTYKKTLDQADTPASGFGGKVEVRPPVGGGHTLRIGADFRQSDGDLSEYRYLASGAGNGSRFAGGTNSDFGLFLEDDYTLGPILLTGGVRADRWSIRDGYHRNLNAAGGVIEDSTYTDRSGWDFSWRVGATADVAHGVRARAAAYTGLRQPTLNELYRPFVVFPVTTYANANLRNERLEGYEVGLDATAARGVDFSLTLFTNRVENAIANVTLSGTDRQRQNVDAVKSTGVELAATLGSGPLKFQGTLAYTDAKVEGSGVSAALDGNRPAQTPDFAASATVSWEPKKDWRIAATLRYVADQFEGDDETDVLPAATTVDLFAQVPVVEKFSLVLRVENLFDEKIVTRNQAGSIDYGAPLTLWGGVRYGF